jgi:5'-nucleotidase
MPTGGMERAVVYVDLDGVLAEFPENLCDVDSSIAELCRQWCEETGEHHSDFEGLFSTLRTKEGADEAISRLMQKFEVYILSTAPWKNVSSWTDKRIWVEKNLPSLPKKRLLLSYNKSLMRGRYLIDDRPKNGALEFGEHDGQGWIHFGSDEFPDWEAVLNYLEC